MPTRRPRSGPVPARPSPAWHRRGLDGPTMPNPYQNSEDPYSYPHQADAGDRVGGGLARRITEHVAGTLRT